MKLLIAIIQNDDSHAVLTELNKVGLMATKLSTSGGFMRAGNVTLLMGIEEERIPEVINIMEKYSSKRQQIISNTPASTFISEAFSSPPIKVTVGGATIFVVDVDRFYKL